MKRADGSELLSHSTLFPDRPFGPQMKRADGSELLSQFDKAQLFLKKYHHPQTQAGRVLSVPSAYLLTLMDKK